MRCTDLIATLQSKLWLYEYFGKNQCTLKYVHMKLLEVPSLLFVLQIVKIIIITLMFKLSPPRNPSPEWRDFTWEEGFIFSMQCTLMGTKGRLKIRGSVSRKRYFLFSCSYLIGATTQFDHVSPHLCNRPTGEVAMKCYCRR